MSKSILVIEDNTDLAYGLQNNLEIEGYAVEVASDGRQGLSAALRNTADLILLDLMLPGMDGFKILKEVRSSGSTTPILILTARGEESDKVRGLRLGADDYVTKPFGVLELLARVEALLRRAGLLKGDETRKCWEFSDVRVDTATRTVTRGTTEIPMTPKEYELLVALLKRGGAVASRLDLMSEVWGYQADVLSRTVDTHVAELRKKIEADSSNPDHIITVRKVGYRLER